MVPGDHPSPFRAVLSTVSAHFRIGAIIDAVVIELGGPGRGPVLLSAA
jgi:hypothetical protein